MMHGYGGERSTVLAGTRVLDLSRTLAGAYATKLLAELGATVVKAEGRAGDPLRSWRASSGAIVGDGVLFRYLNESKHSVAEDAGDGRVRALMKGADLIVDSGTLSQADIDRIRATAPACVVVSVTDVGLRGPWAGRPTTEFILQAASGSIGSRGTLDTPPLYAGGRVGEWLAGSYASAIAVALLLGARRTGRGDHADVSVLESLAIATHAYAALKASLGGTGFPASKRQAEVPSIEPTADGFVAFTTNTRQQFDDLMALVERPDLAEDEELATRNGRQARRDEFRRILHCWTTRHTTAEIVELAGLFRIPVTALGDPDTVTEMEQIRARHVYRPGPDGGYLRPRPPLHFHDVPTGDLRSAPRLGADDGEEFWENRPRPPVPDDRRGELPLSGLRIIEIASWWAGPSSTQLLAALGADVVRVESTTRTDGQRLTSTAWLPPTEHWWETSYLFQAVNPNKRSVTLDLTMPAGRDLALRLLEDADVLVENFSPRVLDGFGLTWDVVHARNPRCVMVRMPAFGLDGPWRDRTGFAQTMEALSGMAWLTGFPDALPVLPRGPCDPLAGMHAATAISAALVHRELTGLGVLVEVPMVEVVLNVAAEIVLERSAYGARLERQGNRGPQAAPQGVYPALGEDRWVAIATETDAQWRALCGVVKGSIGWSGGDLGSVEARRAAHDLIDKDISAWTGALEADDVVERLVAVGVPAAVVAETTEVVANPQLRARGFVEAFHHPLLGRHEVATLPFRLESYDGPWIRTPSPMLGQHNQEVLAALGLGDDDIDLLRASRVIGTRPAD